MLLLGSYGMLEFPTPDSPTANCFISPPMSFLTCNSQPPAFKILRRPPVKLWPHCGTILDCLPGLCTEAFPHPILVPLCRDCPPHEETLPVPPSHSFYLSSDLHFLTFWEAGCSSRFATLHAGLSHGTMGGWHFAGFTLDFGHSLGLCFVKTGHHGWAPGSAQE